MGTLAVICLLAPHARSQDSATSGQDQAAPIQFHATTPEPSAPERTVEVQFHNTTPEINPTGAGFQVGSTADPATVGESQQEVDNLGNQKQTLDSEIRYAQSKLDEARRRLDVETMAGHSDASEKWNQEVHDWDARVKDLEAQENVVEGQIQNAVQSTQPSAPSDDLIVPGDILELYVVEDPSFNGRYQVRRGGYIILPAVGRIPVAGKSFPDAEAEVRKALETTQLQHATVMVEKVEGSDIETGPVVFLSGEFRSVRPFRIPPGTKATVVNVILSCGGVTDKADLTRVKVMRLVANKSVVEEVNVQNILDGSGLTSDLTLNDGDVLTIPAGAANVVYVTGRVVRPGEQSLHPGDKLSVFAAVLDAGGFARFADLKKVYVLRATPDGTKVRIPVNVNAIQHGRAPDILLQGNDILVVPEKFFSF